jgi:hypothetical protein
MTRSTQFGQRTASPGVVALVRVGLRVGVECWSGRAISIGCCCIISDKFEGFSISHTTVADEQGWVRARAGSWPYRVDPGLSDVCTGYLPRGFRATPSHFSQQFDLLFVGVINLEQPTPACGCFASDRHLRWMLFSTCGKPLCSVPKSWLWFSLPATCKRSGGSTLDSA